MSASKLPLLTRLHGAQGLSRSQRQIADCLIAHMNEAALWGECVETQDMRIGIENFLKNGPRQPAPFVHA